MPSPYSLEPVGGDVLRNFVVPIPTTKRRYVKGVEFRPGNPTVVHHAAIRLDQTGASKRFDEGDPQPGYEGVTPPSARYPAGHFLGWTPGQVRPLAPDGVSWPLEPGSDLVLQLHLRPAANTETVRASVGFYFTDTPPARRPAMIRLGRQDIDIPPGRREHVISDDYVLPVSVEVQELQPHAHFRARQIQAAARLPDGTTQPLIYIRDWDFHWQEVYRLRQPLRLPRGTVLTMRYVYDNSAQNRRSPIRPPGRVRWGQNSTDEMGDLWLQVFASTPEDLRLLERHVQQKMVREDAIGYEQLLEGDPENPRLHESLAACYLQLGEGHRAIHHLEASLRLEPQSPIGHYNLASAHAALGRIDEAVVHFEDAIRLNPDLALAHNSLGVALQMRGKPDAALPHYREALRLDAEYALAYNNLGTALKALGRLDEARAHFTRAAAIKPDDPLPYLNLGEVCVAQGHIEEAVESFQQALAKEADWMPALMNLGWILATHVEDAVRVPHEAVRLAERAVALTDRRDSRALDLLAAAYAAASDYERAIGTAEAALRAVKDPAGPEAAALASRLRLYQQHRSYRHDFRGFTLPF